MRPPAARFPPAFVAADLPQSLVLLSFLHFITLVSRAIDISSKQPKSHLDTHPSKAYVTGPALVELADPITWTRL
jgi:hypothetical protein